MIYWIYRPTGSEEINTLDDYQFQTNARDSKKVSVNAKLLTLSLLVF
jgi:hypothetical protein